MEITNRQTILSPSDIDNQHIFIINDIDLNIAPSSIQIREEDLTYVHRVLRTKVATKVPTGHGQVHVTVSLPFTNRQMLAMHRLLIEIQNSPFCYIDNRYLRETIVPDWPLHQNMAFTVRSLSMRNMPDTADGWIMDLELIWFNYFPFMHNFLYREDWVTEFIIDESKYASGDLFSYSIGWELDKNTLERKHRPSVIYRTTTNEVGFQENYPGESPSGIGATRSVENYFRSWSVQLDQYRSNNIRTIYDMMIVHPGVEGDLNPLPGNMIPSRVVTQPKNSRIYTRYINLLQRDALYKNFGIDVEQDIIELDNELDPERRSNWDAFFAATGENGIPECFGLHTVRVPTTLRRKWIKQMLEHNFGVRMTFNIYKEIRLPQKFTDKIKKAQSEAIANFADTIHSIRNRHIYTYDPTGNEDSRTIPIMRRPYRITSPYGYRIHPKTKKQHFHNGIDIGGPLGTPLYPPGEGTVFVVVGGPGEDPDEISGRWVGVRLDDGKVWQYLHLNAVYVKEGERVTRDTVLGTLGNTGRSTGPHLHLIYKPSGSNRHADPLPELDRLYKTGEWRNDLNKDSEVEESAIEDYPIYGPPAPESVLDQFSLEDQQVIAAATANLKTNLDVTEEESEALRDLFLVLDSEGWKYYDQDTSILNTWYKTITIDVAHNGSNFVEGLSAFPEEFAHEGVLLSNIAGGINHVVANIPVLSWEFPTQQHLGSIEPQYQLEFLCTDDQGNLEGISTLAQLIRSMRSVLQSNARKYRQVVDSWTLSVDTFLTRFFGSYQDQDFMKYQEAGSIGDIKLKKRIAIARSAAETVEGHPGLSRMVFDLEETNPYEQEKITSTAPLLEDKENAREKVLRALWNLDITGQSKEVVLGIFLASKVGANITNPTADDFGKFKLQTVYNPAAAFLFPTKGDWTKHKNAGFGHDAVFLEQNGKRYIVVKSANPEEAEMFRALGIDVQTYKLNLEDLKNYIKQANVRQKNPNPNVEAKIEDFDDSMDQVLPDFGGGQIDSTTGSEVLIIDADGLDTLSGFEIDSEFEYDPRFIPDTLLDDRGRYLKQQYQNEPWLPNANDVYETFGLVNIGYYDISGIYDKHPELLGVPIVRILEYRIAVKQVVKTANRMLAEEQVGGIPEAQVQSDLYNLPIKTEMWRAWQAYLEEFIKIPVHDLGIYEIKADPETALLELYGNPNWPIPNAGATGEGWKTQISPETQKEAAAIAHDYVGWWGSPSGLMSAVDNNIWGAIQGTVGAAMFSTIDASTPKKNMREEAIGKLVNRYMRAFPVQIYFPDLGTQIQELVGDVLGNTWTEDGKTPAIQSLYQSFYINADSCGHITNVPFATTPIWQSMKPGQAVYDQYGTLQNTSENTSSGGLIGGIENVVNPIMGLGSGVATLGSYVLNPFLTPIYNIGTRAYNRHPVDNVLPDFWQIWQGAREARDAAISNYLPSSVESWLNPQQEIGPPLGSPFKYPTDQQVEKEKIRYLKQILAALADGILGDPALLEVLGLLDLAAKLDKPRIVGTECYPDLDLPFHPFFGSTFDVSPGFYMWNIYEDSGALNPLDQEEIYERVYSIIDNAYESMKRMEKGEKYDTRLDLIVPESGLDQPLQSLTQITPEGTDAQYDGFGPMSSPFARPSGAKAAEERFKKIAINKGLDKGIWSSKPAEYIPNIRLANAEGEFGRGSGIHYPTRASPYDYSVLKRELDQVEDMFGSREGFLNQALDLENAPDTATSIQGTNLERPIESVHGFDPDTLKKLAKDSSVDLMSRKFTLARAYPTFKLFFIEEDEAETRFLNFDDFYTYNAVKDFTVHRSCKLAADHAVIKIQNVAGSLDGTRRNTIVDLDYFTEDVNQKIDKTGQDLYGKYTVANNPITDGTAQQQPFGAVVLRPGLNVQLRAGYSNDPDNLHVLISGRVVNVSWNKQADLAEIVIQSFGTELVQAIKGMSRDGSKGEIYQTTHQLLGAMMLEPELVHFGRWEFGQQFQFGEAKDSRLDFKDYAKEGYMENWKVTNALTQAVMNHPYLVALIGGVATLGSFFPIGRVLGLTKFGARIAAKTGITAAGVSKGALVKALAVSPQAARLVGFRGLRPLLSQVKQANKSPEWAAYIAKSTAEFLKKMRKLEGDELVNEIFKYEVFLRGQLVKNQWMAKPWITMADIGKAGVWNSIGLVPVQRGFSILAGTPVKLTLAAFGLGVVSDLIITNVLRPLYDKTKGALERFFARTTVHLFLSPQDDNLYPPHPKDYMQMEGGMIAETTKMLNLSASRILFGSDTPAELVMGLFFPERFLSKKVDAVACGYQIVSTTIWDIFYEMTLRHPGWVFAPRPYGNAFRYTMFFGVPTQRYWARPAPNMFIARANKLRKFLQSNGGAKDDIYGELEVTEQEFAHLYGKEKLEILKDNLSAYQLKKELIAIPLKEYLRSLQLRFVPFRKYHLFTSERDIVWNGIMGSEDAVVNAVDVTYYRLPKDVEQGPIETALFKAHSYIPENLLRIAPIRYPNCKTYQMAMRYGMGELIHRMKDMYRGEFIVLGNAAIQPYDIGILADTYNDMVGPIEVQAVTHIFSHETGFITEIKPGALVFGNEISSWPLIEAMKLFALAVKDIEDRYKGVRAEESEVVTKGDAAWGRTGFLGGLSYFINLWGSLDAGKFDSYISEKYKTMFGDEGPNLHALTGNFPGPGLAPVDQTVDEMFQYAKFFATLPASIVGMSMTAGGTLLSAVGYLDDQMEDFVSSIKFTDDAIGKAGTAISAPPAKTGLIKSFLKSPKAMVGAGIAITGAGLIAGSAVVNEYLQIPSMVWLVGGPSIFLQCLRNEAIIVVPLIKNGHPVVSGVAYNDPSMLWNSFRGKLSRWIDDTASGTLDMVQLYSRYGSAIWKELNNPALAEMTGDTALPIAQLTESRYLKP